ncbi:hypothetical protein [Paenibacillus ginsengarvi]|uniref:hypothetical protein n=1 Tax=Paenibacillus ginsengarvi TaxID=400777 RepID=UPI0013159515|nr:hypothetical protein [Paenibacillus ginsengarvi]
MSWPLWFMERVVILLYASLAFLVIKVRGKMLHYRPKHVRLDRADLKAEVIL